MTIAKQRLAELREVAEASENYSDGYSMTIGVREMLALLDALDAKDAALAEARKIIKLVLEEWGAPVEGVLRGTLIARLSQYSTEARAWLARYPKGGCSDNS